MEEITNKVIEMKIGRAFLFRCPEDSELPKFVEEFAQEKEIETGIVNAIGTLKEAKLGYFNTDAGRYEEIKVEGTKELLSAMGNISLKDSRPFAHIHAILGDETGETVGGHLIWGKVLVGEIFILELMGERLERKKEGSLYLWPPYPPIH